MSTKTGLMVVSLALSIVIGVVISKSGATSGDADRAGPGGRQLLIGLSLDTLKEARWQADSELFQAKCKELGAKVLVQAANSDDTRQINDCQSLLTSNVDVLVIVAHDSDAMAKAVRLAHDTNTPVIAYDRIINNSDLDIYLSFDNVKVGRLQAQWLMDHMPKPGHGSIVRIYGSKTDHNAVLFKQGQDEVLKPYVDRGDVKVVWEDWADDWRPDNAKRIVNAAITKFGPGAINAVLASNDGTASGAIQCLSENGLAGKVLVTGQDADLVACQSIIAGTQSMTVYKPLKKLATLAAEVAVKMAARKVVVAPQTVNNGQIDVPSILGEIVAVDKFNMMQTVVADGLHTKEEIYGGK